MCIWFLIADARVRSVVFVNDPQTVQPISSMLIGFIDSQAAEIILCDCSLVNGSGGNTFSKVSLYNWVELSSHIGCFDCSSFSLALYFSLRFLDLIFQTSC